MNKEERIPVAILSLKLQCEGLIYVVMLMHILVTGTITTTETGNDAAARQADERDKGVTFKNCAPFTKCISRINNTDIDTAQDITIVMPMYNLIECSDNYSKTSGSLWQYCKDEPNDNL